MDLGEALRFSDSGGGGKTHRQEERTLTFTIPTAVKGISHTGTWTTNNDGIRDDNGTVSVQLLYHFPCTLPLFVDHTMLINRTVQLIAGTILCASACVYMGNNLQYEHQSNQLQVAY